MMNRRQILKFAGGIAGTVILEGCAPRNLVERVGYLESQLRLAEQREENIDRIYYELPNHVYTLDSLVKIKEGGEEFERYVRGVVIDRKIYTVAHLLRVDFITRVIAQNGAGFKIKGTFMPTILSQEVFLKEKKLEAVVIDFDRDVAVFNLPENLILPDFPAKPNPNLKLGQEVYLIGNPGDIGVNIRHGRISDLDGYKGGRLNRDSIFGLDISIFAGDSGSPIVNSNFELVGLCSYRFSIGKLDYSSQLSYGIKIGEFLKYS